MLHHAYAIEAPAEEGVEVALAWARKELGLMGPGNPDLLVLRYGLLSSEEAKSLAAVALQAPLAGAHKVVIVAASRAYREAQNALLKLFEEPPPGTYLFLILPALGALVPTLRSRVHVLDQNVRHRKSYTAGPASEFLRATREKRSAIIKKLALGRDEEERRAHRDAALAIVDGIEAAIYEDSNVRHRKSYIQLLKEIQALRGYLHERAAPVRMILEHLAIVTPQIKEQEQ